MIEHIIFDFGGVLLQLDPEATWSELRSCLALKTLEDPVFQQVLIDYEVGRFDESTFLSKLRDCSRQEVSDNQLIAAWNAMLGPLPQHRLVMLRELAKKYKLHLLSNTNDTHIRYVYNYLKQTYDIDNFGEEYFDCHYFSHVIKMRKPDQDIYESVIEGIGSRPERMFFIDDTLENVIAARRSGLHAQHHDRQHELVDYMESYLTSVL